MKNSLLYLTFTTLVLIVSCKKDSTTSVNDGVNPNSFLSAAKYDKLIVEIQYVTGFAPTASTVNNLKSFLEQRLNKPTGINIVQNAISSPRKSSYSVTDIRDIESKNRTQNTSGKTLTAYFFFADADYSSNSGNSKVLGIAYGGSSMALFEKTIKEFSGGLGEPSQTDLETAVIEHEFGHILGLVNNGTGMQTEHQDETHGKHCINDKCLMYYTAETSDIIGSIIGGSIPQLDANCIADLKANGGK